MILVEVGVAANRHIDSSARYLRFGSRTVMNTPSRVIVSFERSFGIAFR